MRVLLIILEVGLVVLMGAADAEQARWYTEEQVARGEPLYQANCASCHGQEGEGAPSWRQVKPDGKLPPPPLNGTGHTWHHPMAILERQILTGGAPVGGSMPAFRGKLDRNQVRATVAYVQSLWPDQIYAAWLKRGGLPVSEKRSQEAGERPITRYLRARARGRALSEPLDTPVPGIKRIRMGNDYLYVSDTGRYAFTGTLVDLKTGRNLTRERVEADARAALNAVPESDKVVFSARGNQKAAIDIFTDTSCPFCKKLHEEVPELQKAGITVRYLPYPRGGKAGPGYEGLKQVWCAPDPVKAMDDAKLDLAIESDPGNCDRASLVDQGYRLGNQLGIQGTPAIYLPNGRRIDGYVSAKGLLQQFK